MRHTEEKPQTIIHRAEPAPERITAAAHPVVPGRRSRRNKATLPSHSDRFPPPAICQNRQGARSGDRRAAPCRQPSGDAVRRTTSSNFWPNSHLSFLRFFFLFVLVVRPDQSARSWSPSTKSEKDQENVGDHQDLRPPCLYVHFSGVPMPKDTHQKDLWVVFPTH